MKWLFIAIAAYLLAGIGYAYSQYTDDSEDYVSGNIFNFLFILTWPYDLVGGWLLERAT
jgi:hypothetical protein